MAAPPPLHRYLLENGADPNIQDKTGKTALMHACLQRVGPDVVSLLLSSGADPTLEDHAGLSALIHAVNTCNREVLKVLLDACKAKGKEVIIIMSDKLPSGHHATRRYLNPDQLTGAELQAPARSPAPSACASPPQSGSPGLGLRDSAQIASQPASSVQQVPLGASQRHHQQRVLSEQWSPSPSLSLQGGPEAELLPFPLNGHALLGRPPPVSRHHSMEVKDAAALLRSAEGRSGGEGERRPGRRGFGRKMSYDSSTSALHSASHPNLHQDGFPSPAGEGSSDALRHLHVSSLQNVVRRRNIGVDHYSSDSQLPQFGRAGSGHKGGAGQEVEAERLKLLCGRSSTLSESRESLEGSQQRRGGAGAGQERRGSGALLLDHIAHTRPGYLPPLNLRAPIPDIGVSLGSSHQLGEISKTLSGGPAGSKPVPPGAASILRDPRGSKMMWRRHSMQSEQIKQLVDFKECFGH